MMCTDMEDAEEMAEIYGPLCWHGHKQDLGGHNNFMRYSFTKIVQMQGIVDMERPKKGGGFYNQTEGNEMTGSQSKLGCKIGQTAKKGLWERPKRSSKSD